MALPPEPPPTPTGYTLLGLLSFGRELSGYELRRWGENLRFFWAAPAMSQVYREVERLAAAGYVEQRLVVRDGTRRTKVYRLTAAGKAALRRWLAEPPDPPVLKHPVALRVFFGHMLDPSDLRRAIEAHRSWCEQMLDELGAVRRGLGDDPVFRNAALVAEWGLGYYRGELDAARGIEGTVAGTDAAPRSEAVGAADGDGAAHADDGQHADGERPGGDDHAGGGDQGGGDQGGDVEAAGAG